MFVFSCSLKTGDQRSSLQTNKFHTATSPEEVFFFGSKITSTKEPIPVVPKLHRSMSSKSLTSGLWGRTQLISHEDG